MKKIISIIIVAILGVTALLYGIRVSMKDVAAISIIGGADGPTSIFLAGKVGHSYSLIFIISGVIILLIALIFIFRRK